MPRLERVKWGKLDWLTPTEASKAMMKEIEDINRAIEAYDSNRTKLNEEELKRIYVQQRMSEAASSTVTTAALTSANQSSPTSTMIQRFTLPSNSSATNPFTLELPTMEESFGSSSKTTTTPSPTTNNTPTQPSFSFTIPQMDQLSINSVAAPLLFTTPFTLTPSNITAEPVNSSTTTFTNPF